MQNREQLFHGIVQTIRSFYNDSENKRLRADINWSALAKACGIADESIPNFNPRNEDLGQGGIHIILYLKEGKAGLLRRLAVTKVTCFIDYYGNRPCTGEGRIWLPNQVATVNLQKEIDQVVARSLPLL